MGPCILSQRALILGPEISPLLEEIDSQVAQSKDAVIFCIFLTAPMLLAVPALVAAAWVPTWPIARSTHRVRMAVSPVMMSPEEEASLWRAL